MLLGITGTLGAGKGVVAEYLKAKGFKHCAVSDWFLTEVARERGLKPDRIARRTIANEYRAQGPTKLMEAVYEKADPLLKRGENVILEPQHTSAEVEFIQSKGGAVIAVDADIDIRYERIKKRGSEKDHVTYEEFKAQQETEMYSKDPNKQNLAEAMKRADFSIHNNGPLENLQKEIDGILERVRV